MRETGLWCLSRIGARKLFYGPINQVIPAPTATRWVEGLIKVPHSADALVAIARRTGDATRDLACQVHAPACRGEVDPAGVARFEWDVRLAGSIGLIDRGGGMAERLAAHLRTA